jgi:hypothetical protein
MGEVVYMNKKKIFGVAKYLDTGYRTKGLVNGVDFEVVSFIILDLLNLKGYSLGGYLKTSSNELFNNINSNYLDATNTLINEMKKDGEVAGVSETLIPNNEDYAFYQLKGVEIDIDLATEIGLGVVKYRGHYMLYYPHYQQESDAYVEMMLMKTYFQLKYPENIDEKIKENFAKYEKAIRPLISINVPKHMKRLKEIYS